MTVAAPTALTSPENVASRDDNACEQVDPNPVYEKMDLQSNASYGKVHR